MSGVGLAIAASLAWSGLDAMRKRLGGRLGAVPLVVVMCGGQLPLFGAWAAWGGEFERGLARGYLAPGLALLALNLAANVAFVEAVRRSAFSVTLPWLSFTPVFSALVAGPLLGERAGVAQWLGAGVVVVGALMLGAAGAQRGDERGVRALGRALVREPGPLLMLATAAAWSTTAVLDKVALQHTGPALHAAVQVGGVGLGLAGWLALRGQLATLRPALAAAPAVALTVGFSALAIGLQLSAVQLVAVATVETIKRAVGLGAAIVLGRVLFAEPVTLLNVLAIVAMGLGSTLAITGP